MRMPAWIVLILLLASIGCRSSAKKMEEVVPSVPVQEVTNEVQLPAPEPVVEPPTTTVEIAQPVGTLEVILEVPLTPEEEAVVVELETQIAELESVLAEGRSEVQETLTRLRTNREKKIGRIRTNLKAAADAFENALEEVRLVEGGEHHGE